MNSTLANMTSRMMIGNIDIPLIIVMRPNPQSFNKTTTKRNQETLTNSGWVSTHWGNNRDVINISGVTASKINPGRRKSDGTIETYSGGGVIQSALNSFTGVSADKGPVQWADVDRFLMKIEQLVKLDKERLGSLTEMLSATADTLLSPLSSISVSNPFSGNRETLVNSIQDGSAKMAQSFIIYQYCIYFGYFLNFSYSENVNDPRRYSYNLSFKVTESSTDWLTKNLITNFPEARALNLFTQVKDITNYAINLASNADQLLKGIFL